MRLWVRKGHPKKVKGKKQNLWSRGFLLNWHGWKWFQALFPPLKSASLTSCHELRCHLAANHWHAWRKCHWGDKRKILSGWMERVEPNPGLVANLANGCKMWYGEAANMPCFCTALAKESVAHGMSFVSNTLRIFNGLHGSSVRTFLNKCER